VIDPIARAGRLRTDLEGMERLRGPVIDFDTDGSSPPERYKVRFRLQSLLGVNGDDPIYTTPGHVHEIEIRLSAGYPKYLSNDDVTFVTTPIFHPHVFTDGRVCIGGYRPSESLDHFVLRMARFIQWQPDYMNINSPANSAAMSFFNAHRTLFPVDRTALPDDLREVVEARRFHVAERAGPPKRRFVVESPGAPRRRFKVSGSGSGGGQR
jgi:ubiquitin-protein ligase